MIMLDFLKKLIGGGGTSTSDPHGLFFYVQCDRCGATVRLHVHKMHDLNREDDSFVWRKTIVDSRCFKPIPTTVTFDGRYQITHQEIDGGRYITAEEYERLKNSARSEADQDEPTP